ncbi:MAG: hypothetical protein WKF89_09505 [Chitinophagaceae bacterium]
MVGIFKNKNSGNALLLLLYGLLLKFPLFLHPVKPLTQPGDNFIYIVITRFLDPFAKTAPVIYSFLAFLLFFTQATLLNRIVNSLKLFPRQNYLVGMSFLLVTSFMQEWSYFSAPLLVNSLMIWIWYRMVGLYNHNNPKTSIYNVSALVGLTPLIYSPSVAFLVLLFLSLLITRPLRIAEWMVALLGIITPYYFIFVTLFLTDQWHSNRVIPYLDLQMPKLPSSPWIIGGILLFFIPLISGGFFVQKHLNKMLIQVRKAWSLLLAFLIISMLIILMNPAVNYLHWMLIVVPIATFHAATYFYINSRWIGLCIFWISFVFAIMVSYEIRW